MAEVTLLRRSGRRLAPLDRRLLLLAGLLIGAAASFIGWGLPWTDGAPSTYILQLRATKLAGLICVGTAIGLATVLFQTLSNNRILTPSIMGFDALFLLMQSVMVMMFGLATMAQLSGFAGFLLNAGVMMVAALLLFTGLLRRTRGDIQLMILVGVVIAVLLRTLAVFLQRLMDPSAFAVVQTRMFAQFGSIDRGALLAAVGVTLLATLWLLRRAALLDVAALGRDQARSLGVRYDRLHMQLLCIIAALVSVSTALVGPIAFLGLLVTSLAHSLMQSHRHALLLPASALIAAIVLVAGQTLFERLLQLQSSLAIVIEFCGGLLFILLLLKGKLR
ncbi:iron chelate uptake ABC transporter family permease subunit [Phaeobacter inhibens]|uniref:iron chelate uptake ABC transporter family permease subunit n=1 Tax=Phaeobacter inhibens TaxID=221822 RepID=UPI0021A2EECF|nr:iron chelate uptake ABC transporter family permease subunit [Phaeobacter inhibens]